MISIGQTVKYDPLDGVRCAGFVAYSTKVLGKICYVNHPHRWFQAVAEDGTKTSFKFEDLKDKVKFVKE